ncbi:MAG: FAD-binding protein [Bacteroidia bacterium]|nr:FAD-binding protein [Bacteroidia bacterium]
MSASSQLGYLPGDFAAPHAAYYDETIAALRAETLAALAASPFPAGALPPFGAAAYLEAPGYTSLETGYTREAGGGIHVAVLTPMPGVTPRMWDWWFGWHGSSSSRYKLWHPQAHLSARWEDGQDHPGYVGRTSLIEEYIGDQAFSAAIQFRHPEACGFSFAAAGDPGEAVYICARLGHPSLPVDFGWLVHQVRRTAQGAEMRSRFWMGGPYIQVRQEGLLAGAVSALLQRLPVMAPGFGADMLRHCAEEMTHLAAFLPALYAEFGGETCRMILPEQPDFEAVIQEATFNKWLPSHRPCRIFVPETVDEVAQALRYAREAGKKVSICSGGHSFSTNHLRPDSVLILMKHFSRYRIDAERMTATAGPGVGGSQLMLALYEQGLFFPAGHCKGVCIGGYLLQGGYGWNGRKLGLACESVTGLDIVTAQGELVHASASENPDLFWAARGSGPGFFGVVVRFHLRLHPLPPYRAIMAHEFPIRHLEAVFRWAWEAGPGIPKAVEFQMLMSKNMLNLLGPGIEAVAPIFADTRDEFEDAMAFMKNSPIRHKALIATPAFDPGIERLYASVMAHYPENAHWSVDNMWTHASIEDLLPFLHEMAETMPPPPSHALWLNWHPGQLSADMAYSNEDQIYLALYANWKNPADTAAYGSWAPELMGRMAHLSTGIQLADEGLHRRQARFLSPAHFARLQAIRAQWDPQGLFHSWHGHA